MKLKKLISTLLVTTMAVSMVGCGSGTKSEDTSAAPTEAASTTEDTSTDTTATNASTDTAEVDMTKAPTVTLFVDESWWPYDKWEGAIPEEFSKRVGVNIEVIRAADENQLAMLVASGDMPDLVCTGRTQYVANSETSYALDELTTQYPNISFNPNPMYKFVNQANDGHFYTIGVGYSPDSEYEKYDKILTEGPGFMVRKDIVEELGLKIETLDDLDAAFAAVKEKHPELITVIFNSAHRFNWLMVQMGLTMGGYSDNNGKLEWYLRQPGLLDFYKKVNEWYRKGYITAENFAYQSEDESGKRCLAGEVFANFGYDNHADGLNSGIKKNGDDFSFLQITDAISDKCARYDTATGWRGLYITKSSKNVEAAFKVLSYAYSDEGMRLLMWGIEGEDYTLDSEGYPNFNYDFQEGDLQPRGLKFWGWLVHNAIVTSIAEANVDTQTATARRNMTKYVSRNPSIGMIRFDTDSEEANISTKLNEMVRNQQTYILMAESEAECVKAYNDMLQKAEEIGMKKLEDYGNKAYPNLKAKFDEINAAQ